MPNIRTPQPRSIISTQTARPRFDLFEDESVDNNILQEAEMTTVASRFRKSIPRTTVMPHPLVAGVTRLGVEVELENIRTRMPASHYWEVKPDGSLRNSGAEFVFREPLGGADLYDACLNLDSMLHDKNPSTSWRCSVHVHVDVRDFTVQQVKNFILIYAALERVLFRCSGWHRYTNNFCCALGFAQGQIATLSRLWLSRESRFLQNCVNSWSKYSAINLVPMATFGSIEIRISESKWKKGQLLRHCNRMLSISNLAKSWEGDEYGLLAFLSSSDVRALLPKGLPKGMDDSLLYEDLLQGIQIAYEIKSLYKVHMNPLLGSTGDSGVPTTGRRDVWDHVKSCVTVESLDLGLRVYLENRQMPSTITFQILKEITELGFSYKWFIDEHSQEAEDFRSFVRQ